ncbi:cadmium metallothionein precursor [Clonorchis sinensis]|uniref:Cadmium metallothionein n=1 Tax=Clonorchis sinensis TaxID=79923 RepID=G7YL89_CLOSI|nr:cadmium metallothionein precursor [Clonorchis sinensis]
MRVFVGIILALVYRCVNMTEMGFGPNLRCYQCNSLTQPRCADHFDNRTMILTPCPDDGRNYSRCVKMIQEMISRFGIFTPNKTTSNVEYFSWQTVSSGDA